MNTAEQQQTDGQTNGGCSGCDLEEIEKLTCKAKRFGAQAKVLDEVDGDLANYREQYRQARKAYTDARAAVDLDLASIEATLTTVWDKLFPPNCSRLSDDDKRCMKESVTKVLEEIAACSGPPGCHSPCKDDDVGDVDSQHDIAALTAEIAKRRSNLAASTTYFKDLIKEPDVIKQEMATQRVNADKLKTDVEQGADSSAVPSLYARLLILKYWANLSHAGHGFASTAQYLDCLCGVLKCLVSGWTTVAVLEGRLALLKCYEDARQKACAKKKDDTLEVILELYAECCRKKQSTTPTPTPTPCEDQPQSAANMS